jgi:two-component system NtrC family sensor kinase
MAFGLLNRSNVPPIARKAFIVFAAFVTAATIGLSLLSFARKVDSFSRAGFEAVRSGDGLLVTWLDSEGSAAAAGMKPGDRIITIDGQTAASVPDAAKALAVGPYPHRLLALSAGEVRAIAVGKPALRIDRTYLFLALVGLLYLVIGLYTASRERTAAAVVFYALCLSSFAVYVLTPSEPHDALWKAFLLVEDAYRALLPGLLLHFFLLFPRPVSAKLRRPVAALGYVPGAAYLVLQEGPLLGLPLDPALTFEWATRAWLLAFGLAGAAVLARIARLLARHRDDAQSHKQIRWIGLGVTVGLTPFLVLSVLPRVLGIATPWLSSLAVVPLVFVPLAFAYAILRWRLWDVEIFVREAVATTASVLLGGMTFLLLNALLDRTLQTMAESGKNVIAFGSGLVLASMLVPVKKRLSDVLERFQYHETFRARRALLDIARDFSTPRPQAELVRAIVQRVEDGLHVVPCALLLFDDPAVPRDRAELLAAELSREEIWRLRGAALPAAESAAALRLHEEGFRTLFAMRCGGQVVGALGVGHKDGRVPLSSEDEALLVAVMAQAGLAYENARLYGALADRLEEIRTLQQYQESVIRSSSSGILVVGPDGRLHSANPAFAALAGRSERELDGKPLSDVLPGVVLPDSAPADGEAEQTVEARFTRPDGEERDLRVSVSAFQGDPGRRVVLVDDVTDRVRAERALAERERLASLGVLAAGVAHEVNTPIAGLSSYAQLLLADTAPGDPRYAILKKMERQTFRAAHLVNNLLEFARPRPAANVRTDLKAVVASAAESVETTLGSRRVAIEGNGDSEGLWVSGDARELEQVFVNLLTNARDASPEGGEIRCGFARENGSARVWVADRGTGLPPGAQQKIFQPFFTTKKSGGTGLGLVISREIVRRHGGDLSISPREGGGVEAVVLLPLAGPSA